MEQILSQTIGSTVNILSGLVTEHLGYVTSSTKHVANMRRKMKVLESKSKDVKEHMKRNKINNKEVPARVEGWLEEVEDVKNEVISILSNDIGCLHMKKRYRAGKSALNSIKEIERLINEEINWSNAVVPLGRVDSKPASTFAPSPSHETTQSDFKSRDETFKNALKYLQDDKANQLIALCGMGGVGKTTMMEQLEKVVKDNKKFDWIAKAVIGQNPNILSIQKDIAVYIGDGDLPEASKSARVDHLHNSFKTLSEDRKMVLIILDDVWEKIELRDIGLTSPLPNGMKLLLTSRDSNICRQIAVEAKSSFQLLRVNILVDAEAQSFFSQITGVTEEDDYDMYQTGCDIVRRCGGLPLALKLIGTTLKSQENIYVWRNTLNCLKKNDFDNNVEKIIKISYEHIKDEDKEVFLHCGLFPEDSNIPIVDLARYAWGLKLFKNVSTWREAKEMTHACVDNLINANLLINGDHLGCVKMHDVVLSVVLGRLIKGDPTWVINHGDASKWGGVEMRESCKRISLTCTGIKEFPRDFKYPKLSLLQLMHGELSVKFPEDFYENMESLEVLSYYKMMYPMLPRSLQCSINLKSLCLYECKLIYDCPFVGDLVNLEVLSLAHCGIRWLPSTIGKLRKLKVLDLTGCIHLHIDGGVFKNLERLEELYMKVSDKKAIRFTYSSFEELKMLSSKLCALEVEFPFELVWLKNMNFNKLDKFKIAMGCQFENDEKYSLKNTLNLVTIHSSDLCDSKINELFKKTEKLHLQVKDMIGLEDIVSIPFDQYSFYNLSDLELCNCSELKYLFPVPVASGLRKLERLKVSSCNVLEALVYDDGSEINSVAGKFVPH
ncbi:putative P-loop containing nucleoside triphosphate hydrolase, leucine-rich repeat domain superfamily [Helianthus anomalus]